MVEFSGAEHSVLGRTLRHRVLVAAAAIERCAQIDVAATGALGVDFINHCRGNGITEAEADLGLRLLGYVVERAPGHPEAAAWRYEAALMCAFLAEERDSVADLDRALAWMIAVARDRTAAEELAECAAVEATAFTALRLCAADEGDLDATNARCLTDVVAALGSEVRSPERLTEFRLGQAFAHRWAYVITEDATDLDRVVSGASLVLDGLSSDDDARPDALEALAAAQGERHRLYGDPLLLEAAIAAAAEMGSLLSTDDHRKPWSHLLLAGLLSVRYWAADPRHEVDRDRAIVEYAMAHAEAGLDDHHASDYGFLLLLRGSDTDEIGDLRAGIDLLSGLDDQDLSVTDALAEAYAILAGLDGPHYLWSVVEWATRAIALADTAGDAAMDIRIRRLDAVEVATKEFGTAAVAAKVSVQEMLADAQAVVRSVSTASPASRVRLAARLVLVTVSSLGDLLALDGPDKLRESIQAQIELLATVRALVPHENHEPLDAVTRWLEAMGTAFVAGGPTQVGSWPSFEPLFTLSGRLPASGPPSPDEEMEDAVMALMQRMHERLSVGQQPHEFVGELTALVWKVDAMPESQRREELQELLSLLSAAVGPPGTTPSITKLVRRLNSMEGVEAVEAAAVFATAAECRAALDSGDTRRALQAYQTIERRAAAVVQGTGLDAVAHLARGISRTQLSSVLPQDLVDADIARLEGIWQQGSAGATPTVQMASVAFDIGSRLRLRGQPGDRAKSRQWGLAALTADGPTVWPDSTTSVIYGPATPDQDVTAWCLDDNAPDDLVKVLEARRAVALAAACGRPPAPAVSTGPEEVRQTLRAVQTDLLVYLVAECSAHRGFALLVPVAGPALIMPLPLLRTTLLTSYTTVSSGAPGASTMARRQAWRAALDDVCEWAWEAAGASIQQAASGTSVVLVPLGVLGLVPWAAARRMVGGRRRYLVEDVELSSVPSARLLGEIAGRPQSPQGSAVFVGNPDRENAAAGTAAAALRDIFEPGGRFLGGHGQAPRPWRVSSNGPGTPEQICEAMAQGLALLHLDCPAVSDSRAPQTSHIRLHSGASLKASALVAATYDLGLVTLADHSCPADNAYDEAMTLPAALLVAGARSVVATRWTVPSAHVSYLFYHYRRQYGCSARAALRAAQLWMIDPDRVVPADAPDHLGETDFAAIENWAAFTCFGP